MTTPTTVLEHLDPTQLTIDANVRADVRLDPEFLASIKQHGVLQPVVAHRTEAGVYVLYGQRRTLAATWRSGWLLLRPAE
ncbi:ParB/Srx family N-terminal domain-containing protein [Arthrobacter antioxidans]|uniref:ParB/Srx family N-terminal domain-containing protein n=1 Tax=Arthrobacter antioxidans TaxID=2895818 RepID=UPI00300E2B56